MNQIPCKIIRGGTSKGVYLLERDLPPAGDERDSLLLRLMGSPDLRQIDGLGGATSVTSKVAILAPSDHIGIDVDYTFAQVSVDKPLVSYAGNCGNISAGVGPFAIETGMVDATSPTTTVRIYNTNTGKVMVETVQTPEGVITYEGDYSIPGVPGTAAPVKIRFVEPAGTFGKGLLPTGNASDLLDIPQFGSLEASIVDAANPLVFVRAQDIGMSGKELPEEINKEAELCALLERIRAAAAMKIGLINSIEESATVSPGVPKMTIVSSPESYKATSGEEISGGGIDLLSRMMSMQKAHPTYAMTGAMCTAVAAVIPGTVVYQAKRPNADPANLRIAHPGGILEAGVDYTEEEGEMIIKSAYGYRTARLLMSGTAYC